MVAVVSKRYTDTVFKLELGYLLPWLKPLSSLDPDDIHLRIRKKARMALKEKDNIPF